MAVVGSIAVEYLAQGARAFIQLNKEAAASIAEVESKAKTVQDHLRGVVAPLADASKAVVRFGDGLIHSGQVLSTFAYRLMLITAPLAKFVYEVGQVGMELETVMGMVATQLDMGGAALARFTQETTKYITDLSLKFPLAADDIAKAMYYLVSSLTIDPEVARSMLVPIAKAAVAGRATAEEAAKAATVVMQVYDLISEDAAETAANLEHVYDVIFEAVKKGRAEYADMASQLGDFVKLAQQAGATFEEVMALFAMATREIDPAIAATWIKRMYTELTRPGFMEAMEKFGVEMWQYQETADGVVKSIRPAIEIITDLAAVIRDTADEQEQFNIIHAAFPNIRAYQAFLTYIQKLPELKEWTKSFTEAIGTVDEAFEIMVDLVKAQLTLLGNAFIAIGLDVFETYKEDLKRFIAYLKDVVITLREMDPELKKQLLAWSAFLLALGPIALILGTILMGLGSLVTVLGALISPAGLAAAIIAIELFGDLLTEAGDAIEAFGGGLPGLITFLASLAVELGLISEAEAEKALAALGIEAAISTDKVAPLANEIRELVDTISEFADKVKTAAGWIAEHFDKIVLAVKRFVAIWATMQLVTWAEQLLGLAAALKGLAGAAVLLALGGLEKAMWAVLAAVEALLGTGAATAVLDWIIALSAQAGPLALLAAAIAAIALYELKHRDAVVAEKEAMLDLAGSYEEYRQVFEEWVKEHYAAADAMGHLIINEERLRREGMLTREEFERYKATLAEVGGAQEALASDTEKLRPVFERLSLDLRNMWSIARSWAVDAAEEISQVVEGISESMKAFGDVVRETITAAMQAMYDAVSTHVEKIVAAWDKFNEGLIMTELRGFVTRMTQAHNYHREREELVAQAAAKEAALIADGDAEALEAHRQATQNELAELDHRYKEEQAKRKWNEEIQALIAKAGHLQRLIDMQRAHIEELAELKAHFAEIIAERIQKALDEERISEAEAEMLIRMAYAKLAAEVATKTAMAQIADYYYDLMIVGAITAEQMVTMTLESMTQKADAIMAGAVEKLHTYGAQFQAILDQIRSVAEAGPELPEPYVPPIVPGVPAAAPRAPGAPAAPRETREATIMRALADIAGAIDDIFARLLGAVDKVRDVRRITDEQLQAMIDQLKRFVSAMADLVVWYDKTWDKLVKKSDIEEVGMVLALLGQMTDVIVGLSQLGDISFPPLENLFSLLEDLVDRMAAFIVRYDQMWDEIVKKAAIEEVQAIFDLLASIPDAVEGLLAIGAGGFGGPSWRDALGRFFDSLDSFVEEFARRVEVWQDSVSRMQLDLGRDIADTVVALSETIQPLLDLADYAPDEAAFKAGVDLFFANLEYFLDEFAWGMWRFEELASQKAAQTAELCRRILGALGETIQPLLDLAEYAPDQAAFRAGVNLFFANLEYFLDEFARGLWRFVALASAKAAETAELMERIVGALGETIQPLLDLAEYTVTPAEFARAADLFFDHLARFIEMFAERAEQFGAQMSEETAALAEVIGKAVGGIGAAIQPLINLAKYGYAEDEHGRKVWWDPEDLVRSYEHFFYHLGMILFLLEQEARRWHVSDAAKALAEAVARVMSDLSTALGFLVDVADYGVDQSAFALLGFIHFLDDLKAIILLIAQAGSEMVDAIPLAEAWAAACCEVLSSIQRGIDKLNELSGLGIAPHNLVEAGKLLIQSLMDGMAEKAPEAIAVLIRVLDKVVDIIVSWADFDGVPAMYAVGQSLINGIIAGVWSRASALYDAVWQVVQNAIAAAEAAAEMGSESRTMWRFGVNMVRGLIGGIQSQRSALAATLSALEQYGGFSLQPALAGVEAGASGGQVVHHHYEYNISPRYEQVQSPADIRRDLEALDWQRRRERV